MEQGKRLFTNAVVSSIRRPVSMLVSVFLTPFILVHLGEELYGIWTVAGSVLAYSGLLSLGLNSAVDYKIPKLLERNDSKGINAVVSSIFAFYCASAIIVIGFGAVLVWKFPIWFKVPPELFGPARIVVALSTINVALHMPLSVYYGLVAGIQRHDVNTGVALVFDVLRAVGIVIVLSVGFGIVALATISTASQLATGFAVAFASYKLVEGLDVNRRFIDWKLLPGLVTYSVNTLTYGSGQLILLQSGKTLVGFLYGPAAVTVFTIPFMLLFVAGQAVFQAAATAKPAVSMLEAQGRRSDVNRTYILTTKYSMMVVFPLTALLLLNGESVLAAWVGPELSERSALYLSVMAIPQMLRVVNFSGFFILAGLGLHQLFGAVVLIQSLSSVVLGYLLAEPGGLGILGVALGISIPELIVSSVVVPAHCWKTLGLSVRKDLAKSALLALSAGIPFVLYCLIVRFFTTLETRTEFLAVFAASALPLLAGVWFLGLTNQERELLRHYLEPIWGRLRSRRPH